MHHQSVAAALWLLVSVSYGIVSAKVMSVLSIFGHESNCNLLVISSA